MAARPLAIAHRAGNDLDLLARAAQLGVDYAETDVWLRRGRLEVRHDKTAGPLPFLWDRWSLRPNWSRRLLLGDVLRAAAGRVRLLLDLKGQDARLPDSLAEEIAHAGGEDAVAFTGGWRYLDQLGELLPQAPRFYTIGGRDGLAAMHARLASRPVPGVSIDGRIVVQADAAALKAGGVGTIIAWAVETPDAAERLLHWGVDGITTKSWELLAALREGRLS
ncbi:MAG: glycerophosphodiester phosphodiesterase [Chloroflexi bacterium]|nr:glycerophosphodiester phosphodiesterase [Chloroflexota bacterium]